MQYCEYFINKLIFQVFNLDFIKNKKMVIFLIKTVNIPRLQLKFPQTGTKHDIHRTCSN